MGKTIQVASLMEHHLPQILNQQYFLFPLFFLMLFQSIFVTSQDFGKQLFELYSLYLSVFWAQVVVLLSKVLAVFLQVLKPTPPTPSIK